ncbi:Adenosylmethionine decarboxylase [Popillia japonica]|uniref:Adenosylmethionine decarboxylase n=1 Tax=Popillia japonica TaxID=7064 RepID=A0AAW1JXZ2_POPJA
MAATDDSMSDSVQFFEGVEKLLEIWFTSSDNNSKCADLRKIPRNKLDTLLKIVRCEIISFCRNEQIDAYVLRTLADGPECKGLKLQGLEISVTN